MDCLSLDSPLLGPVANASSPFHSPSFDADVFLSMELPRPTSPRLSDSKGALAELAQETRLWGPTSVANGSIKLDVAAFARSFEPELTSFSSPSIPRLETVQRKHRRGDEEDDGRRPAKRARLLSLGSLAESDLLGVMTSAYDSLAASLTAGGQSPLPPHGMVPRQSSTVTPAGAPSHNDHGAATAATSTTRSRYTTTKSHSATGAAGAAPSPSPRRGPSRHATRASARHASKLMLSASSSSLATSPVSSPSTSSSPVSASLSPKRAAAAGANNSRPLPPLLAASRLAAKKARAEARRAARRAAGGASSGAGTDAEDDSDWEPESAGVKMIGAYTIEERRARVQRFLSKRKKRVWNHKVKYDCRKKLADNRPRYKGRFVRRADIPAFLARLAAQKAGDESGAIATQATRHSDIAGDAVDGAGVVATSRSHRIFRPDGPSSAFRSLSASPSSASSLSPPHSVR